MQRQWLVERLEQGASLEEIGREAGLHASTVSYWLKKHGLSAAGGGRFAARGAADRTRLEHLAESGATLSEIASALDRSIATVRYWLERWGIERVPPPRRSPPDPGSAPPIVDMKCRKHGRSTFRLEGRGSYRCTRCRQERVAKRRRHVKRVLVEEAGGRCALCGYDRCIAALQFHHRDPESKRFALSGRGLTRSIDEARAEARQCVLLCANCHAEVEAGYRDLNEM